MKLIEQNVELWEQLDIWDHIAKCTRVCYQSTFKDKFISNEDWCKNVLIKDTIEASHMSMLEHGTVYLIIGKDEIDPATLHILLNNPYTKYFYNDNSCCYYITTNLRVIYENNWLDIWKKFDSVCTNFHAKRVTISFITNIGISRELNRHRCHSIAEESTRYCNYTKERFNGDVTFVKPSWYDDATTDAKLTFKSILKESSKTYNTLIKNYNWKPQQAREVLPLDTKTQVIHTAFLSDWMKFINLRYYGVSGTPHPNMKVVAKKVMDLLLEKYLKYD